MKGFPEIRGKHRPRPPHWQLRTAPGARRASPGAGDAAVPQAHAAVPAGRDERSGGAGGFLPPLRPCRETRLLEEAVAEEGATNRLIRRNPRAPAQTGPPGDSPGSLPSPTRRGISLRRPSAPF